jgi:regulator of PEP synthase PpsR (kinase-PPPase family)
MSSSLRIGDGRKKSATVTFRLDENIISTLRSKSESRHISLNMMVNQILQDFIEWYIYETKVGIISLFKPVVAEIFKKLTEQQIIELAATVGKEATTDATLL